MAVEHLKATAITNLDATPPTVATTGEGGPGMLREIDGFATVSASASVGSTYQLVRVRSNVKMKSLVFESQAQAAGKFQLGVYYSDDVRDGTSLANSGAVISVSLFANDIDCTSAVNPTEELSEANSYTPTMRNQPLWQAAGLASDPGGKFDIVATVHTTAVTTGTGRINVKALYVE